MISMPMPILTDMSGAYIEHSVVITNFVASVYKQLSGSTCRVFPDNVQYKWIVDGKEKTVIPDATINCRVKYRRGNTFFDVPKFVMEVLSASTEKNDRGEKMELYRKMEVEEYWIVDWRKKQVEVYVLDYEEDGTPQYYLFKIVTEETKEELQMASFPNIHINFDELFDLSLI